MNGAIHTAGRVNTEASSLHVKYRLHDDPKSKPEFAITLSTANQLNNSTGICNDYEVGWHLTVML